MITIASPKGRSSQENGSSTKETQKKINPKFVYGVFVGSLATLFATTYFKTPWGFVFLLLLLTLINGPKLFSIFNDKNESDQLESGCDSNGSGQSKELSTTEFLKEIIKEKNGTLTLSCIGALLLVFGLKGFIDGKNTTKIRLVYGLCVVLSLVTFIVFSIKFWKYSKEQLEKERNNSNCDTELCESYKPTPNLDENEKPWNKNERNNIKNKSDEESDETYIPTRRVNK